LNKVLIISSTNRPESNTIRVSRRYAQILKELGTEHDILDFRQLPADITFSEMFGHRSEPYSVLMEKYIKPYTKMVFVVPEYNGSFPGVLKTFIDTIHPRDWAGKKICLVGVSDGRAGNARGMDHLVLIFQYLKTHVYFHKVPISKIDDVMNEQGDFVSQEQTLVCRRQMEGFLNF